jgi:hypothetical protein
MGSPPGYLSLEGKDPSGDGTAEFIVARKKIDDLQRYGPEWKFDNLHILKEILGDPVVILEGLKREEVEHGLCYSGHASKRMRGPDITLPPPPDMVAVVIVSPDHRGIVVLDWEWRRECPDAPGWPEGWEDDFARVKWPTI